jgi:hypothetical protein
MRSIALATVLGLLAVPAASALEVQSLAGRTIDEWFSGSAAQIKARFVNTTIEIKVTSRALGGMRGGPRTGPLILFLGKGGAMLSWAAGAKTVGSGRWEIKSYGAGVALPCFYFDGPQGRSECFYGGAANYAQATAGNPFKLKAGAPVPTSLGGSATIASVASKLGL